MTLCVACQFKLTPGEDDDAAIRVEVQRYDRLEARYLTTADYSALMQMNTDYPMETKTLIEKMLKLGDVRDMNISNRFLMFYQDSTLQMVVSDAEAKYAKMDDINDELTRAFEKLSEWIPNIKVPTFYSQIGAFDQSIVVGDNTVGISLDKYMGEDYPIYKRYYSKQQVRSMKRSYIVPDCICFYLLSMYQLEDFDERPQIEKDLHIGKIMWVTNQVLGRNAFTMTYVAPIERYMKVHKNVTVKQLLEAENYPDFKK